MKESNPHRIEKKSMEIIDREVGKLNYSLEQCKTVKRVIHATADPGFAELVKFSPDALNIAKQLILNGADIITDVTMLKAGINKRKLKEFGGEVKCFISDKDIKEGSEITGLTRSILSMRKAVKLTNKKIFAIGNAPTALFEILRLIKEEQIEIDFIVGTPVGFVGAEESKEELMKMEVPYISVKGRKGGSAVAASIINSIIYMIGD